MCSVFLQTASVLNFINLITLFICYTWTNILQNAENFSLYFNKRWMNPDKSLVNVCFCEVSGFYFHCFSFLVLRLRHALVWNTSEHHSSVFCFYEQYYCLYFRIAMCFWIFSVWFTILHLKVQRIILLLKELNRRMKYFMHVWSCAFMHEAHWL